MNEKEKWIIEYLTDTTRCNLGFVDMLDESFVMAFIDRFDVKSVNVVVGAPKCKELSALLSKMYRDNILSRFPHGIRRGLSQDGNFPKWIFSYKLAERSY